MVDVAYGKIQVFFSYAHEDEAVCEELIHCLKPLREEGVISEWYDRQIAAGEDWRKEIDANLARAKIVVLMISPDFLESGYCMGVELKQALEHHWQRRCRIVPVVLRKCDWSKTLFGSFQALPKNATPILDWPKRAEALASVSDGIRAVCRDIVDWQNPYRRSSVGDWTETEMNILDKQTRQQITTTIELRILAKSVKKNRVTVGFTAKRDGEIIPISSFQATGYISGVYNLGTDRFDIPLDTPLEDNVGSYMRQIGQTLPRNAEVEKNERGRGEQKVIVGGNAYYCMWRGYEAIISVGFDRLVCASKTWRCIDVPLDGIVRSEQETPLWKMKNVLVDYGWGGRSSGKNVLADLVKRAGSGRSVRLSKLVRKARSTVADDDQLVCPVCETLVKAINMERHVQSVHGDPLTNQLERLRREKPQRSELSGEVEARREQIKSLARSSGHEGLVTCPDCGLELKAKNLVRHFDRQHAS